MRRMKRYRCKFIKIEQCHMPYLLKVTMAHGVDTDELLRRIKTYHEQYNPYGRSTELNINSLRITSLPDLPSDITVLDCSNTDITSIPDHPNLIELYCWGTKITRIPYAPNLRVLYCTNTDITVIPSLPHLVRLMCDNTLITVLPDLPNLQLLLCSCLLMDDYAGCHIQGDNERYIHIQSYIQQTQNKKELRESRLRSIKRYRLIKEDLMAAAWHPSRVESWLNHGEAVFNMMTGYA